MPSAELSLQSPEQKVHHARVYRRMWLAITAGCAAVSGGVAKLAPETPHHPYEIHGPLAAVAGLGALVTVAAFTQILDGTQLVRDAKAGLDHAERYSELSVGYDEDLDVTFGDDA